MILPPLPQMWGINRMRTIYSYNEKKQELEFEVDEEEQI